MKLDVEKFELLLGILFRDPPKSLFGENLFRMNNIHLLRGVVLMGKIRLKMTDVKDCMDATNIFHT